MTQQEKSLLLQDLCGRLPYGVKVNISASRPDLYDNFVKSINDATINSIDLNIEKCRFKEFWWDTYIVNVRPYLRPMSSMTEEEKNDLFQLMGRGTDIERIDFYISHHFDYRGLIKKDLALEAPEGMYKHE